MVPDSTVKSPATVDQVEAVVPTRVNAAPPVTVSAPVSVIALTAYVVVALVLFAPTPTTRAKAMKPIPKPLNIFFII